MKQHRQNRVEEVLESIDDIQPAGVPDFFYARLSARMQKERREAQPAFFLMRPAVITVTLSVLLLINVFVLSRPAQEQKRSASRGNATIVSFSDAYNLSPSSVYE